MTTKTERVVKMRADMAALRTQIDALKNPSIGETIDEAVQLYMRENGEKSYSVALQAILAANPDLAKEYLESFASHAFMTK